MEKILKVFISLVFVLLVSTTIQAKENLTEINDKALVTAIIEEYSKLKGIELDEGNRIRKSSDFAIPIDFEFYWEDEDIDLRDVDVKNGIVSFSKIDYDNAIMYSNYYTYKDGYWFNIAEEIIGFTYHRDGSQIVATIKSLDEYYFYFDRDSCEYSTDYDYLPLNNCMGNYQKIIKKKFTTSDYSNGSRTTTKYPSNQNYTEYNDFTSKIVEKYKMENIIRQIVYMLVEKVDLLT